MKARDFQIKQAVLSGKNRRNMNGEYFSWDLIIGVLCILVLSVFFSLDYVNFIQHNLIEYDEGYNATVAANLVRYGQYRVSYPEHIVFYNFITTGQTVLLPTAFLYRIFGINQVTTSIVPVIYSLCSLWAMWVLLAICLKEKGTKPWTLSAICISLLVLSDGLYYYVSTHLIGEIAAFFFLLIVYIFVFLYYTLKRSWYLLISGAALVAAFLTKTSMIFFVVTTVGILVVETFIVKRITFKAMIAFFIGALLSFLFIDSIKYIQLGGVRNYIEWWQSEWRNMINQSSGVDLEYSILEKVNYLETIFRGCNRFFCLFMILLPVIVYLYCLIRSSKFGIKENGFVAMIWAGVGGASLVVYFILLGGSGLVYARRHEVNELFVRLFALYFIMFFIVKICKKCSFHQYNRKQMVESIFGILCLLIMLAMVFPMNIIKNNWKQYISKETEDTYSAYLMQEFLKEVDELPEEAVLYAAGWWQEPDVTLFLDWEMKDVFKSDSETGLSDQAYFISGNFINNVSKEMIENEIGCDLIRIDESEVDYNRYHNQFNRMDFDNFAIYKMLRQ